MLKELSTCTLQCTYVSPVRTTVCRGCRADYEFLTVQYKLQRSKTRGVIVQ